jgi:hypothetical protein
MSTSRPPEPPALDLRVARLRGPVLAQLRAPERRRSPRVALAGAIALAVVLAGVLVALPSRTAPALAVTQTDGTLELRIADATAGPDELTRELREAGVRGEVRLLPVPADQVGTWAVVEERAAPPGTKPNLDPNGHNEVRLSSIDFGREALRLPLDKVRQSTGYFVFWAGRAAQPGEKAIDGPQAFVEHVQDEFPHAAP